MERIIGEVFEYHGDKLMVVEDFGCSVCYFGKNCYKKHLDPVAGYCSKYDRSDGRNVGFRYVGKATPNPEPNAGEKTESRKNDRLDGKLRWELLPLPDMEDIVSVYTFGAEKYGPHTWRELENGFDRYKAALLRHLVSFEKGEEFDAESGLPALAHMAWNAIALLAIWRDSRARQHPASQPESHQSTTTEAGQEACQP